MREMEQGGDWDVGHLQEVLQAQSGCLVLDVREYPEYAAGRVPGARLLPLGDVAQAMATMDKAKTVYVICQTGRRAGEARRRLQALGFTDVRKVTGGFVAWQAAGFPVERDARAPWSLERQVRLVAGLLVVTGVLLSVTVAASFVWLAGFVGAGLVFAALTDTCAMGLLLARLPWNRAAKMATGTAEAACGISDHQGRQA